MNNRNKLSLFIFIFVFIFVVVPAFSFALETETPQTLSGIIDKLTPLIIDETQRSFFIISLENDMNDYKIYTENTGQYNILSESNVQHVSVIVEYQYSDQTNENALTSVTIGTSPIIPTTIQPESKGFEWIFLLPLITIPSVWIPILYFNHRDRQRQRERERARIRRTNAELNEALRRAGVSVSQRNYDTPEPDPKPPKKEKKPKPLKHSLPSRTSKAKNIIKENKKVNR